MHRRFLIVEDDPLVAMMLEDYLQQMHRQPVGAVGNVSAALDAIQTQEIDAAIVDVVLERGENAEPVAEALRSKRLPFMIATGGFIMPPGAAFAGRPLLLKPFTFASLASAIDELG